MCQLCKNSRPTVGKTLIGVQSFPLVTGKLRLGGSQMGGAIKR